ncbi:response regulator [Leisingera sp. S232]|uniref:response regulator n=1 Tax=Leisingera sp. S232 TaxID=3415132 RepID=UPI003C7AF85F
MTKRIKLAIIIDDDEVDQRIYRRVMDRSGLVDNVMCFTYADEALAHLIAHPDLEVDVIFLDINMPRMNGFEFLDAAMQEFGSAFARMVVVMLTTSLHPEDEQRAKGMEVVKEFIRKPLTVEHVAEVAKLLEQREPQ